MELGYLLLYALLVCAITLWAFVKVRPYAYRMLWLAYALIAVSSLLCVLFQRQLLGYGDMLNLWYDLSDTTSWGYALILICCLLAFRPFLHFGARTSIAGFGRSAAQRSFFFAFAVFYLCCAAIFIVLSLDLVRSALGPSDFGAIRGELYSSTENESSLVLTTSPIAGLAYKICNLFKLLSVVVAFAMLKEDFHSGIAALLLAATVFVFFIYANANAARGGMLIFFYCSAIIGLMFYRHLPHKNRRRVSIGAILLTAVVFAFVAAVTFSRFASDGGDGNPILRNVMFYLGHAPIEFSKLTGSLQSFGGGKVILGRLSAHYFGTPYSWDLVQSDIGYPDLGPVFTTFLGFLYADFGVIGCLLFCTLWSMFMCRLLRNGQNRISTIYILTYYLNFFVTGAFVVGRLEFAALITAHLIWAAIRGIESIWGTKQVSNRLSRKAVAGRDTRGMKLATAEPS